MGAGSQWQSNQTGSIYSLWPVLRQILDTIKKEKKTYLYLLPGHMKHIFQGTYFESCILGFLVFFFSPRKLQRWHPFTKSLSAWFKLISSTKTAIIVAVWLLPVSIMCVYIIVIYQQSPWSCIVTQDYDIHCSQSLLHQLQTNDQQQPELQGLWYNSANFRAVVGDSKNQTVACQIIRTLSFYMIHQKKPVFWLQHIWCTFLWGR